MRIRRTFPIVLVVVIVAAAVTLAVQLRKARSSGTCPAVARRRRIFLPRSRPGTESERGQGVAFRSATIRSTSASSVTPGFEFERDLDEAAFAVHYPASWPGGGTGGSSPELRFSEVLRRKISRRARHRLSAADRPIGRKLSLGRHLHHSSGRQIVARRGAQRRFRGCLESRRPCRHPRYHRPVQTAGFSIRRPVVTSAILQVRSVGQSGLGSGAR